MQRAVLLRVTDVEKWEREGLCLCRPGPAGRQGRAVGRARGLAAHAVPAAPAGQKVSRLPLLGWVWPSVNRATALASQAMPTFTGHPALSGCP